MTHDHKAAKRTAETILLLPAGQHKNLSACYLDLDARYKELERLAKASLVDHDETPECGFDRNSSLSENCYVCACGWSSKDDSALRAFLEKGDDK